ncbi:hypothetical protein RJ55_07278 [Drechmeria coniospora]|nr:hypothetical protein RJ55_07278 [Drechmeria coniospora]
MGSLQRSALPMHPMRARIAPTDGGRTALASQVLECDAMTYGVLREDLVLERRPSDAAAGPWNGTPHQQLLGGWVVRLDSPRRPCARDMPNAACILWAVAVGAKAKMPGLALGPCLAPDADHPWLSAVSCLPACRVAAKAGPSPAPPAPAAVPQAIDRKLSGCPRRASIEPVVEFWRCSLRRRRVPATLAPAARRAMLDERGKRKMEAGGRQLVIVAALHTHPAALEGRGGGGGLAASPGLRWWQANVVQAMAAHAGIDSTCRHRQHMQASTAHAGIDSTCKHSCRGTPRVHAHEHWRREAWCARATVGRACTHNAAGNGRIRALLAVRTRGHHAVRPLRPRQMMRSNGPPSACPLGPCSLRPHAPNVLLLRRRLSLFERAAGVGGKVRAMLVAALVAISGGIENPWAGASTRYMEK